MGENSPTKPDRNLALELVRVTEAAALAAARWVGRGDKIAADGAAVDAMRFVLDTVAMDGVVVIGEGEKDEAPMLFDGEQIGDGSPPVVDIAVDPLEGTTLCARGMPSALAVIALAEKGSMFDPGPCVYMEKMAGGEEIADLLDLDRPLPETLKLIAQRKGESVGDVIVVMLDRPRHEQAMKEVREACGRILLITDGDVSASLLAVSERSPVDLLWGIGGTPEGVISAAALKSMGGQLIGRLWPRNDEERSVAVDAGYDLDRVLTANDLCSGDDVFFSATGVTDGDVLQGVRYRGPGATTESLVMRSRSPARPVTSGDSSLAAWLRTARRCGRWLATRSGRGSCGRWAARSFAPTCSSLRRCAPPSRELTSPTTSSTRWVAAPTATSPSVTIAGPRTSPPLRPPPGSSGSSTWAGWGGVEAPRQPPC